MSLPITDERRLDPHSWASMAMQRTLFDDAGFLDVKVAQGIDEDDLVNLADLGIATHLPWALGAAPMVTPFWAECGEHPQMPNVALLKVPAANAIVAMNERLRELNLEALVVEPFRPVKLQARGFATVFWRPFGGKPGAKRINEIIAKMSVKELVERGMRAAKGYLNAEIKADKKFERAMQKLRETKWRSVRHAAEKLGMKANEVAKLYLTYLGNLVPNRFTLSVKNKPHMTGGSADIVLKKMGGDPVFMGSPSDDVNSVQEGEPTAIGKLEFFESFDSFPAFVDAVKNNWAVRQYFQDFFGDVEPTRGHFIEAQENRRYLYWAVMAVGGTFYNEKGLDGEYWHCNFGNLLGGKQATEFPGAGNGPHSLLANIRDGSGELVAVWSAEVAHRQATDFIDPRFVY